MTTTELYSGYEPGNKSSSRVLNPPGGKSNNIFGGGEDTNQSPNRRAHQPAQHGQQAPPPAQAQNQDRPAASGASRQEVTPQQAAQNQKAKNRGDLDPAPFASFTESGTKSHPTQFDECSSESQNDADFRSYSVTAYRDAMATNAAVRQRARGSATGATNPITHEDNCQAQPNPFQNYEQGRVHPQEVNQDRGHGRKGQQNTQRRGKFNPITGEEYPDNYGQDEEHEKEGDGKTEETKEQNDKPTDTAETKEEPKPEETKEEPKTEQQAPPAVKPADPNSYLVKKVRQPPGGASSGLW